jgi:PAS domain S-box-containing protein
LNSPSFVYRELAKDIDPPVFIYLGHLSREAWPFILEYLLKSESSRGLRGMSPLGSNQNNPLDEGVHSHIDTRFKSRLLDAVGQALIATDRQRRIIYWNQAAERLYGWLAEEVMGYPIVEITRSMELRERTEEIMAALEDGRIWTGECVVRRKNGTSFTAMVTETAVHDEEGALVAVIGISTDISELKMPGELSRSEERFRALAQHASDIVTLLEADGIIRYQSPSVERILGYQPEEMLGKNAFDYVHPEDLARVQSKSFRQ